MKGMKKDDKKKTATKKYKSGGSVYSPSRGGKVYSPSKSGK